MISLRILIRQPVVGNCFKPRLCLATNFSTAGSNSSSSNSSDDERKKDMPTKKTEALEKLNLLLNKMIKEDITTKQSVKLELAKPLDKRRNVIKLEKRQKIESEREKQVLNTVQEVAKVVGGDVKKTESELLQKLLNPVKEETTTTTADNLSEIFKDMKIDRESKPAQGASRAHQVREMLQNLKPKQEASKTTTARRVTRKHLTTQESSDHIVEERVNLFGVECLGIFPPAAEVSAWPKQNMNKTWEALEEREKRLAVTHPPANYFQQMIQWTEQGKIWKFPIDNEQGMEAEKSVYFTEHVFLEKHIESWCPSKGPIRHFMELVLVGLSKNPYLSVEDKKEHIEWFKNYFNEKKALLQEVAAIPANFEFIKDDTKKIET